MSRFKVDAESGPYYMAVLRMPHYADGERWHWHPLPRTVKSRYSDAIDAYVGGPRKAKPGADDNTKWMARWRQRQWDRVRRRGKAKIVKITAVEWED